ncbi:MAG: hypothetical protein ACJ8IQ_01260 [Chthoniobacterales bacterium]
MNERTKLMRSAALAALAAFLFAIAASAAPTLHESLHTDGATAHICAVTVVASGSVEHDCVAPLAVTFSATPESSLHCERPLALPHVLLFARLEHAPPSCS